MKTLHRGHLKGILLLSFFVVFMVMPLNKASAFPSPVIKDAGVWSWHGPDDSVKTIFYAYISGPSPMDVASFTASGPEGEFDLYCDEYGGSSVKHRGLTYLRLVEYVVADGSYTFEVTDSDGRKASVVKNFYYDENIPQVDVSTMNPPNEVYVDTTTPELSFAPVSGNFYYKVYLSDYDGKVYWYMSSITQNTSFTVPEGLLQPNTPYRWSVRVFDSDTDPQNCRQGLSRCFYIGTKGLNLNSAYLAFVDYQTYPISFNWFGVRATDVAPWDILYLKVISPNSNEYNLNQRLYRLNKPAYYFIRSTSPFPMENGDYTFEIKDDEENIVTRSLSYTHSSLPEINEGSMAPVENTYFDTTTLNFDWAPLGGDGPYYYRVRVWDYNEEVIWYDTVPSTDTSVQIPILGNFPRGSSYKWRLVVYDDPTQPNNMTISSLRTFTINPTPEEQIDAILQFFDQHAEEGDLSGRGRGWLAKLRLCIMRKMLETAGWLIEKDKMKAACFTLQRAYKRCDGDRWPLPDFVVGDAVPELAEMIQTLRTSLGCE